MDLERFRKAIPLGKTAANVVFAIMMTRSDQTNVNNVNAVLEKIQMDIRQKVKEGSSIRKAFVYRNIQLNTFSFEEASVEQIYYMDYIKRGNPLSHTLLRSLIVLEEEAEHHSKSKNILCMILDSTPERAECSQMIDMMKSFEELSYIPVLIKTGEAAASPLDQYINEKCGEIYDRKELMEQDTVTFI
ncbi:MAG: hypothetical protein E7253_00275 [Lachnospiraceae bacterium]|nr:hypothetical protein [Lachnospiraceae bacterium]